MGRNRESGSCAHSCPCSLVVWSVRCECVSSRTIGKDGKAPWKKIKKAKHRAPPSPRPRPPSPQPRISAFNRRPEPLALIPGYPGTSKYFVDYCFDIKDGVWFVLRTSVIFFTANTQPDFDLQLQELEEQLPKQAPKQLDVV